CRHTREKECTGEKELAHFDHRQPALGTAALPDHRPDPGPAGLGAGNRPDPVSGLHPVADATPEGLAEPAPWRAATGGQRSLGPGVPRDLPPGAPRSTPPGSP